jgi:hypothetical protein
VITAAEITFRSGTWPSIRKKVALGSKKSRNLKDYSRFIKLTMALKEYLVSIWIKQIMSKIRFRITFFLLKELESSVKRKKS